MIYMRKNAVFLSVILCCQTASAGNPLQKLLDCQPVVDCIGRWCPDDYCRKKEPSVCVPLCFGCDDYCGKKEPCVCPGLRFTCNDYCKKCLPKVCSSPRCDLLRCGPCDCGSSGCAPDHVASRDKSSDEKAANPVRMSVVSQVVVRGGEADQRNKKSKLAGHQRQSNHPTRQ